MGMQITVEQSMFVQIDQPMSNIDRNIDGTFPCQLMYLVAYKGSQIVRKILHNQERLRMCMRNSVKWNQVRRVQSISDKK